MSQQTNPENNKYSNNHSGSGHHHSSSGYHHNHHSSSSHSSKPSGHRDYYYSEQPAEMMNSEKAQEKIKSLNQRFEEITGESVQNVKTVKRPQRSEPKGKKKKKTGKIILGIFVFFLMLIVVAVSTLMIMINSGKNNLLDYEDTTVEAVEEAEVEEDGKTVRYNGKIYRLNENITSIACLGVDKTDINQNGVVGTSGQADTIIVIAFNTETGKAKVISIPRDTITAIDVYDTKGSFVKVEETQVCLAYAYGDGGKTSCENVIASLQKLMFGIPIRSYAALDLEGIGALNDAIGGVTVTPNESFAGFKKGQSVKLKGDMAMNFVRYRDHKRVDANLYRMQRQRQYIKAFSSTAVRTVGTDLSAISDIYNTALNYSYTNISLSDVSYLAVSFVTKANGEFETFTVPGKMVAGEDSYSEYYVDETLFYETILSIYYNEIGTY